MLCTEEGCSNEAEFSYIWPWGAQGACCGSHRTHLMQRAQQQLDTNIQFTVLDPGKPMPVSRDERAQLRAKIIVLEEDVAERDRRIALHVKNGGEQVEEMRRLRGLVTRLEQELAEAKETVDTALRDRDDARTQAGLAIQERDRLELLVRAPFDNHDTTPPNA